MCMDDVKRLIGEVEVIKEEISKQHEITTRLEAEINRIVKSENDILNDVAMLLREQARNNIETSRLLSDLANESATQAFEIEELKAWKTTMSGGDARNWVASHRANQLRMAYVGIKDSFNENELFELVMDLGIPMSEVTGDSVAEKAMWLVEYSRNHGSFWKLIKICKELRPMSLWPTETGGLSDVK